MIVDEVYIDDSNTDNDEYAKVYIIIGTDIESGHKIQFSPTEFLDTPKALKYAIEKVKKLNSENDGIVENDLGFKMKDFYLKKINLAYIILHGKYVKSKDKDKNLYELNFDYPWG